MGKKGVTVWQEDVSDNESWRAFLKNPDTLLIVELYSDFFGYTEVLTPMIADLMKELGPGFEDAVLWRRCNVIKLENELAALKAEEDKKRAGKGDGADDDGTMAESSRGVSAFSESRQGSQQASSLASGMGANSSMLGGRGGIQQASTMRARSASMFGDIASGSPLMLEVFKGFHHPQPFFLFIRNMKVIDILRAADPPKLSEMTKRYLDDPIGYNSKLSLEVMLKTDAEIEAEKKQAAEEKAHFLLVQSVIEKVECEDPMQVSENEAIQIFQFFVIDGVWSGPISEVWVSEEDGGPYNWEEEAKGFSKLSVDSFIEHFKSTTATVLNTILHPPTPPPEEVMEPSREEKIASLVGEEILENDAVKALLKALLVSEEELADDNEHVAAVLGKEVHEVCAYLTGCEAVTDEAVAAEIAARNPPAQIEDADAEAKAEDTPATAVE